MRLQIIQHSSLANKKSTEPGLLLVLLLLLLFCFFLFNLLKPATPLPIRAKSGNFGQRVNSDIHLQSVRNPDETAPHEPSHQDFQRLLS